MLSDKDNELMCRTGKDKPMGKAMRQFWLPCAMSSELPEPDCDPIHIELLGQNFVAFRDSNGQVGILDEMCCHRGISLTMGRAENCGLRCIYHSWLFATDGSVLETPNVPDENFKTRFKAKAFPVREAAGMIWTYIGDADSVPEFYDFDFLTAPDSKVVSAMAVMGCNWVQVLEGLLDSSHLSLLHISQLQSSLPDIEYVRKISHMAKDAAPKLDVEETPFGLHYSAVRVLEGKAETNVTAFISPFFILNPNDIYIAVVPMTDDKCAFFWVWYDGVLDYGLDPLRTEQLKTVGLLNLEEYGLTRDTFYTAAHPSRANKYQQDREMMRKGHHTGIRHLVQEDANVCISSGTLRSREYEFLGPADAAIAMMYRVLLKSARQVEAGGKPINFNAPVGQLRGARVTLDVGTDWREVVPGNCAPSEKVA